MELEWDRRNYSEVIERAKDVQRIEKEINDHDNYDALRFIALSAMIRLPAFEYNPVQLGISFQYLDELLKRVYDLKSGDIEIASRFAEFIVDVNRDTFRKCASQKLYETSLEMRQEQALAIIDSMVSRNSNDIAAYLSRYRFKARFAYTEPPLDKLDADLQMVLKLDPNNVDGLILAGMYHFQQAGLAIQAGNMEIANERKKQGEELLRRNVSANPTYGLAYQYLGEFLVGEGKIEEAIKIWTDGIEKSNHPAIEELIGRVAIAQIEQKRFDDAENKIKMLNKTELDARLWRPGSVTQIRNMATLLTARLNAAQSALALSKAEESQMAGNRDDSRKYYALMQKKINDALQHLDSLLSTFGKAQDYLIDRQSIYAKLLPDSLMLAGRLFSELGQWDKAAVYFAAADHSVFPKTQDTAALAAANAYQQLNQPEKAVIILEGAAQRSPENISLQYFYVQSQFRYQIGRPDPDLRALEDVEQKLQQLNAFRSQLPQPWIIDLRLIHLEMARASLSNDSEKILEAQVLAMRRFRDLEKKELPVKEGTPAGEKKVYADDLAFLSEIAGIYSSLAQPVDFDRILQKIRELPDGEAVYYSERINDSIRRNDREGAMLIIEEALSNDSLNTGQKQRFVVLMQSMKDDEPNSLDKVYSRLKTTFDQNPNSLKPQAFFLLANMAIDREDIAYAKVLLERLQEVDKVPGTWWRYIQARILLTEPEPPYDTVRQLQAEIAKIRENWDMSYILKATIEEKYLLQNQGLPEIKTDLINAYLEAIRCGNVQPIIWNRLLALFEETGRNEDAKKLRRDALIRAVPLDAAAGQFPQPYQRMYTQIQKAIFDEDPQNADTVAQQCIALAETRREKPELIYSLHLALGKLFYDGGILESAKRHLTVVAKRGSTNVYPLAVCLAKSQYVDDGFNLILDEINRMPSSMPQLLPSILILLTQVHPSEEVFERIDKLMLRIETGERQVLRGTITEDEKDIDLGERRLKTLVVRFPESKELPDPKDIEIYPPAEEGDEKENP
jgi:hypothetical protein